MADIAQVFNYLETELTNLRNLNYLANRHKDLICNNPTRYMKALTERDYPAFKELIKTERVSAIEQIPFKIVYAFARAKGLRNICAVRKYSLIRILKSKGFTLEEISQFWRAKREN